MAESIRIKLHTWIAEHVRGIQYPRQRYESAKPKRPFFRYQMPWEQRLALFLLSLVALVVSLGLLAIGLVFAYSLVMAIIETW